MRDLADFFSKDGWYKDGYYWRRPNHDGSNGKGDLIYNTCGKIVYDQDHSPWARVALTWCFVLLWARKRWPDWDVHPMDAKSWFWRVVNRAINKIFKTHLPFRAQKRMSRDPFIAFYTACVMLGEYRKIELLTMAWYNYRPNTWIWRRFLITGKNFHLGLYYITRGKPSNHEYVRRLDELRELSILYKRKIFKK